MQRFLTILLLLLLPATARATILANWDLDEVLRRADSVVIGKVGAKRYVKVDGTLMTETEVIVERTLFGNKEERIVVSQLGGREGTIVTDIVGDAQLIPERQVLLVTYFHADGRRYLVGMALGCYYVTEDGNVWQNIDVSLIDQQGNIRAPPGQRKQTIEDVQRAIQRVRR